MSHHLYNQVELSAFGGLNLSQFISHMVAKFKLESQSIRSVWINESKIDDESLQELGGITLSHFISVRIESESKDQIVIDCLESSRQLISHLKTKIHSIELDLIVMDTDRLDQDFDSLLGHLQDFTEALSFIRPQLLDGGYLTEPVKWSHAENVFRLSVRAVYDQFFKKNWSEMVGCLKNELVVALDLWMVELGDLKNSLDIETSPIKI